MPTYKKGDENQYLPAVLTALVLIALVIASFVSGAVKGGPEDVNGVILEEVDGMVHANPSGGLTMPTSAPYVVPPTVPPPS